jgi:hypothetical protein
MLGEGGWECGQVSCMAKSSHIVTHANDCTQPIESE